MTVNRSNPEPVESTITINAPLATVWQIFNDNSLLHRWAPPVKKVHWNPELTGAGSVRRCEVLVDGQKGTVEERCISIDPHKSVEYVVENESFGYSQLYQRYGFVAVFDELPGQQISFTIRVQCVPKKVFTRLLNSSATRQRVDTETRQLLHGLRQFVEGTAGDW